MAAERHVKLLIVGSGPAGYTAAIYGARAMLSPLLIQGMQPGGQLTITTDVENWPGDTAVEGPALMQRMEDHARAMGAEIVTDLVTRLDLQRRPFVAECDSGARWTADAVILATGAQARWLGLPSEGSSRASASAPVRPATASSIAASPSSSSAAATPPSRRRCSSPTSRPG